MEVLKNFLIKLGESNIHPLLQIVIMIILLILFFIILKKALINLPKLIQIALGTPGKILILIDKIKNKRK